MEEMLQYQHTESILISQCRMLYLETASDVKNQQTGQTVMSLLI